MDASLSQPPAFARASSSLTLRVSFPLWECVSLFSISLAYITNVSYSPRTYSPSTRYNTEFPFPSEIPGLTVRLLGLPPRRLLDNRRPAPSRTCGYSSVILLEGYEVIGLRGTVVFIPEYAIRYHTTQLLLIHFNHPYTIQIKSHRISKCGM